ncbi:MAG: hypothetical protein ABMA64_04465 [Myxococcota bacterium]
MPRRVAVETPADLVVPAGVGVTRDGVWGTANCGDGGCVLGLLHPAERVILLLDQHDPADRAIPLEALPLPTAVDLVPGATVRSVLTPVSPGDPRGPLADLAFVVDAPSRVVLALTTEHDGAGPHHFPHFVDASLYGPVGREQPEVFGTSSEAPEGRENTWDLGPGRYVLRVTPERQPRLACESFDTPFGPTAVPDWCALPDDPGPYVVVTHFVSTGPADALEPPVTPPAADVVVAPGLPVSVAPGRPPPPASVQVPTRRGEDLVVRWTPREVPLGFRWETPDGGWSEGNCEVHACRFWAVPFDGVELQLGVGEAPTRVALEVTSLPVPADRIPLEPGYVVTSTLRPVAPGDPRGPLLDFALSAPTAGVYRLGVSYPPETHQPSIDPLGPGLNDTGANGLWSRPYEARWYDVSEPGVYPVRVTTCPDCPEVELEVDWQFEAPPG